MLGRIFGGLCLCALGVALCYYAHWIVQQFGRNAWAEVNLGGTKNLIILIGFVMTVLGVLMVFGVVSFSNPADQVAEGFPSGSDS